MKKLALVVTAAAAMFAAAPASAQDMHREGGMHRGGMHSMNRMMHREHRMMHRERHMMRKMMRRHHR